MSASYSGRVYFGLQERDLNYILQVIRRFPEVDEVILFGSRAKGNYKKGSDIDIALKGGRINSSTISRINALLNEESPLPYFFDILHYEKIASKDLKEHIDRVGVSLSLK